MAAADKPLEAIVQEEPAALSETPYRTLNRAIRFPNMDQYQCWQHFAPMLGKSLADAKYSIHQQYEYLCLFAHFVIPNLGPFRGINGGVYRSALGGIGPGEISQNFQQSGRTIRFAFEPTSYLASTGGDRFNRLAIHATLTELRTAGSAAVNLEMHQALVNELTLTDNEEQLTKTHEISNTAWKSQFVLALDLTKTGVVVKEYFYPAVKAAVTEQTVAQLCFSAIRKLDVQGRLEAPCQMIEAYLSRPGQKTDLQFMSCDLVNPQETRFKLYMMELDVSLATAEEYWTLNGALTDDETMLGLQMLRELWMDLGIPEGRRDTPKRPSVPGDPSVIVPFIANYEIHPSQPMPKTKFYFPIAGIPDMKVANVLAAFFERYDMHDHAAVYRENLQSYYPGVDLNVAKDHQVWLSFSYTKKKGPYLTVYYH